MSQKSPWVAGVLNFFLLGAGTLYNGRRLPAGLALTLGGAMLRYIEVRAAPLTTGAVTHEWVIMVVGLGILQIGLALDGYREAKGGQQETGTNAAGPAG